MQPIGLPINILLDSTDRFTATLLDIGNLAGGCLFGAACRGLLRLFGVRSGVGGSLWRGGIVMW